MKKYDAHNVTLKEVPKAKYTLKRLDDGLTKTAQNVTFVEWNENDTFHSSHDDVQVGRSIMLDPNNFYYTWMTTVIVEVVEQRDKYIKFQTKNSTYELTKHF